MGVNPLEVTISKLVFGIPPDFEEKKFIQVEE